ncbi:MAG: isoprenylcysteine carboxylmethyltransferase family protein [Acidobacteriota bacterium]
MQFFLTAGKIRGRVVAGAGTVSLYICYILSLILALKHLWLHGEADLFFTLGYLILLSGILLRVGGLKQLGRYYSSFVEIRVDQKLVTEGLYSLVRHPLHLSYLMEVGGMSLISTSLLSIFLFLASLITIILRNRKEEKALTEHFGSEYLTYMAATPSMNILRGIMHKIRKHKKKK